MRRDPARCDARGRRRGTAPSLTRTAAGCCRSCTPRPGSAPAAAPPARRFFCAQSARPQGWGAAGRVLRRAAPRTRPTFCAAPAAAARGARRERRSGGRAARGAEGGAGRDPARRGGSGGGGARRQVLVPAGADGGRAPPLPAPAAGAGRRLQPGRGERDRPARGAGQPLRLLAGHAPAAAAAGETAVSAAAPRPGPSFRRRPRRRGASGLLPGGGGRRGGRHLPRSARGRRGAGRWGAGTERGRTSGDRGREASTPEPPAAVRGGRRRRAVGAHGRARRAGAPGRSRGLRPAWCAARAAGRSCPGHGMVQGVLGQYQYWRNVGEEVPSLRRESKEKSSVRPEEGCLGLRAS